MGGIPPISGQMASAALPKAALNDSVTCSSSQQLNGTGPHHLQIHRLRRKSRASGRRGKSGGSAFADSATAVHLWTAALSNACKPATLLKTLLKRFKFSRS